MILKKVKLNTLDIGKSYQYCKVSKAAVIADYSERCMLQDALPYEFTGMIMVDCYVWVVG